MAQVKVGLLPLYLELYDRAIPGARSRVERFYAEIAGQLESRGMDLLRSPVCRLKPEFEEAIRSFESAGADGIITLHLAYSPSLESAEALASTKLPILVLDTTPAFDYSPSQDPDELMYNHGIHGVQDMCNLLLRNGKAFHLEAGHWDRSDVLDRVAAWGQPLRLASAMRTARVGRIGESFAGMGDFAVPPETLRSTVGIETVTSSPEIIRSLVPDQNDPEVVAEIASDLLLFDSEGLSPQAHRRTTQACVAVRRWIGREKLTAFTLSFLAIDQASGIPTVPFLEAGKAMSTGIGYAGEGDVLTAALVGALASVFPETTFTEMFCPDWQGESIFLSHMGEMNISLTAERPRLVERDFPWTDAENPVLAIGRFRPGSAALVNLAPAVDNRYTLIIAPISMLDVEGEDRMADSVHGWFRPEMPIAEFLALYSEAGGTHHLALVYGDRAANIARFGELMGWDVAIIGG